MTNDPSRRLATRALHQVLANGRTLDQVNAKQPLTPRATELVYGTLRHLFSLRAELASVLDKPFKPKDRIVESLLLIALYELRHASAPAYAVVNESAALCRPLRKSWAVGVVNAVLRRLSAVESDTEHDHLEHPAWLFTLLAEQYPDEVEAICRTNNTRPPMVLRVNRTRCSRSDYLTRLRDEAGVDATADGPPTAIRLKHPMAQDRLPGFAEGDAAVQDAGAQWASVLLAEPAATRADATPSRTPGGAHRYLDACAAPGGKLFAWNEQLLTERAAASFELHALDASATRLDQCRLIGARLGHHDVVYHQGDATDLAWWDRRPYHTILLDAPCTGTGTIRRHPEIRVLRSPDDLVRYTELQRQLLANLWQTLNQEGTLLYCTCSILADENDDIIAHFLERTPDAHTVPISLPVGRATRHGWQILGPDGDCDGFYYARVARRGN